MAEPWIRSSDLVTLQAVCTADTFTTGSMEFQIFRCFSPTRSSRGEQVSSTRLSSRRTRRRARLTCVKWSHLRQFW